MLRSKFHRIAGILAVTLMAVSASAKADDTCQGKFPNPITDVCWSCGFPLSIGGKKIITMHQEDTDTVGGKMWCKCEDPVRWGLKMSYWEPVAIVEVVRTPYCFVSLNTKINVGIHAPSHAQSAKTPDSSEHAFYTMHWYHNPLLFWLEVLLDNPCLEQGVFDLVNMSELDPLWGDSVSSFIINPDVSLFSNPVAQAACAVDCVAATVGFPIDWFWWCGGCQGSMYPLTGWVSAKNGGVQASSLLVQRYANKMHRQLEIWTGIGDIGLCGVYPQPIMAKSSYKQQMLYPVANTQKIDGKCCQPFGRTTIDWGAGKEFPIKGENFTYQLFRKRDCCSGNLSPVDLF